MALSPDGRWLVAGGGHIKQGDRDTLRTDSRILAWRMSDFDARPLELAGHRGWVTGLKFFGSGERLLSMGEDGVRLWNVSPSTIEAPSVLLSDSGRGALSADGRSVVTITHHELRRWSLDLRELVAIAERAVERGFTDVERRRYFP